MVNVNSANQIQGDLLIAQQQQAQQTPQQKALAQAKAGLEANTSLNSATRGVISTIISSYASFGVDVGKYSDLSYDCLARISQNQHDTIMTMLEDWAVFLQQQAKLDKEAAQKSQEAARYIQSYVLNQNDVKITNSKGEIIKDKRIIARMSPEQKRMVKLAKTYSAIVKNISTPATPVVARRSPVTISDGMEKSPIIWSSMTPSHVCLEPPHEQFGVSTGNSGTDVNNVIN